MNSINAISANNQNYQMTFGNKLSTAEKEALDAAAKAYHSSGSKLSETEKMIMRNQIIADTSEQIAKLFTPKNLIKMTWDYLTIQTAVGLGKFLGKCDKAINKILPKAKPNFAQKMSDKINTMKEYKQYKNQIMQSVKNGEITRQQAEVQLQNKWVTLHYKPEQSTNTQI